MKKMIKVLIICGVMFLTILNFAGSAPVNATTVTGYYFHFYAHNGDGLLMYDYKLDYSFYLCDNDICVSNVNVVSYTWHDNFFTGGEVSGYPTITYIRTWYPSCPMVVQS